MKAHSAGDFCATAHPVWSSGARVYGAKRWRSAKNSDAWLAQLRARMALIAECGGGGRGSVYPITYLFSQHSCCTVDTPATKPTFNR
jgi:hypothetical protein